MAVLSENISEVKIDLLADVRADFKRLAGGFEEEMKAQITSGEGQRPYSAKPQWFNVTRIPQYQGTLAAYADAVAGTRARDRLGRFAKRSKFGRNSVFMQGGYREFREVVGRPGTPVDFFLTGDFVNSLKGQARPTADGAALWLIVANERRSYGTELNSDMVDLIAGRSEVDPFDPTDVAERMMAELYDSA